MVTTDYKEDLEEIFSGIFPTWTTVLATVISFLILFLVLIKLVYKPVKNQFQSRQKYIQDNIDQSEKYSNEALNNRDQANNELVNARLKSTEIINDARVQSAQIKSKEILKAKDSAKTIITNAQRDIDQKKAKFEEESRKAIIDVALEAAKKIVEREIDEKGNAKIVEDFIKGQANEPTK